MSKNDGGPAFPRDGNCSNGMTLRQYYAGQALIPIITNAAAFNAQSPAHIARMAIEAADALIAELEK